MPDNQQKSRRPNGGKLTGWPRPTSTFGASVGLSPLRIALLIVLALSGIAGGYFVGKYLTPAAPVEATKTAPPAKVEQAPHPPATANNTGTYEESLPRDIIIEKDGVLRRIDIPEPEAEIDLGKGKHAPIDLAEDVTTPLAADTATEAETAPPTDEAVPPQVSAPANEGETTDMPSAALETAAPVLVAALPDNIAELQAREGDKLPAWERFAVPIKRAAAPKIVIVMDDLGLDRRRTRETVKLPGPLTLSFMSYAEDLQQQTSQAHLAGHELMLHVPMEPVSSSINPGPNVLLSGMPKDELSKNIVWNLDQVSGYVGINNHMGSRFTADPDGMRVVIDALKSRGLMFLDSLTSGKSVGHDMARAAGIPFAIRNIFLDHDDDLEAIHRQLRRAESVARETGLAIAIGHPRDKTLQALSEWLPTLKDKGFQLVPITAVARIASGG